MQELASREQLRWAFLRWAFVTVPAILLLGFGASRLVPTGSANAWYQVLAKPALTPPDWAFPVIWSLLYVLMGVALAMILNARGAARGLAIAAFAVQLIVNLAWTPLFFGAHRVTLAVAAVGVMLALAILATVLFGRIRTAAAWAMLPYLVWLSFVGVLTWRIGVLNPHAETLVPAASVTQIGN